MTTLPPAQISERTGKPVTDVKNAIIWGNHSSTQYPDVNHGTVGGRPIRDVVQDDDWLNGEFISTVQQRGAAIIKVCFSRSVQTLSGLSFLSSIGSCEIHRASSIVQKRARLIRDSVFREVEAVGAPWGPWTGAILTSMPSQ